MERKPPEFLKLWRSPIKDGLFRLLTKENWQTLCALATFMNEDGVCYPSEKKLAKYLGLASISAVSDRITNLKLKKWNGETVIDVKKNKVKNRDGKTVWGNNTYKINKKIIGIFYDSSPD